MQVPGFGSARPGTPSEGPAGSNTLSSTHEAEPGTPYTHPSLAPMLERSGLISVTDHWGHLFLLFLSFKFLLLCLNSPTKRDPWKPKPLPTSENTGHQVPSLSAGDPGLAVWPGLLCNFQVLPVENLYFFKVPSGLLPRASCNHSKNQEGWSSRSAGDGRDPHRAHFHRYLLPSSRFALCLWLNIENQVISYSFNSGIL